MITFFALQHAPIIVKLVEPKRDPTGIGEVLVGALGLTGVITLAAVLFGVVTAGVLYLIRSRRPLE